MNWKVLTWGMGAGVERLKLNTRRKLVHRGVEKADRNDAVEESMSTATPPLVPASLGPSPFFNSSRFDTGMTLGSSDGTDADVGTLSLVIFSLASEGLFSPSPFLSSYKVKGIPFILTCDEET